MNAPSCSRIGICFCIALAVTNFAWSQDAKPNPRENVKTVIAESIRLLEAKEYTTLLKMLVPPDDLKKFTERSGFEELEKHFVSSNAAPLLAILKSIKDAEPTLEMDGKRAVFKFKEPKEGKKSITFIKVDKFWYLQNSE